MPVHCSFSCIAFLSRERETERQRDRQTETDRHRDRVGDTETERERETETERDRDRNRQRGVGVGGEGGYFLPREYGRLKKIGLIWKIINSSIHAIKGGQRTPCCFEKTINGQWSSQQ